jgi:cell surface protein SprA
LENLVTDGVDATQVVTGNQHHGRIKQLPNSKFSLENAEKQLDSMLKNPVWNLMMKNIYQIPGCLSSRNKKILRFNILYTDPSPLNYISPVEGSPHFRFQVHWQNPEYRVAETPLLKVFNVDKLNYNNDPQAGGDGFFDFMPGLNC